MRFGPDIMSEWKRKRFWSASALVDTGDGFAVELDGRRVRTPAKAELRLPTRAMGDVVAAEWDAQADLIDPRTMPFTRSANAAIDKVRVQRAEVAVMLAGFGDSDLLCYRAVGPAELVARQAELWDPVLEWAAGALAAPLTQVSGVIHRPQPAQSLSALSARLHEMNNFQLAAFHDLVTLSGSLVLGFAAALNWRDAGEVWNLSRLDELWQEEIWGSDAEAREVSELKRKDFLHAKRFYDLSD